MWQWGQRLEAAASSQGAPKALKLEGAGSNFNVNTHGEREVGTKAIDISVS